MNTTIPLLTTMALGVMVGITCTHYKQTQKMVSSGARVVSRQVSEVIPVNDASPIVAVNAAHTLKGERFPATLASHNVFPVANHAVGGPTDNLREDALLEILAEMRREYKSMRMQIAETNRDLAEANFRLDATSNDFRPLRTDSERPYSLDGSNDPLGGNIGAPEALLPPKPK